MASSSIFPDVLSNRNRRTLYICLSAPYGLACPPHYEWSLVVADSTRTPTQMTQHCLTPRYEKATTIRRSSIASSANIYQELPLDNESSRYKEVVALINMKKAYKIDDEDGFASIIQNVDIPPPTANPNTWVRNCIWNFVRTGKIAQVEEKDWGDNLWNEMENRSWKFVDQVVRDDRPGFGSSGRARRIRPAQRIIPALVFRGGRMPPLLQEQQAQEKGAGSSYRTLDERQEYRR